MKILYPGTFDPLTNGHLDLIERAEKIFGNLVVAVLENTSKTPTFNLERRIIQIKNSLSHLPNIEVISYSGLTVDCANDLKANLILRGLRAMSDFEYELQIAHTNKSLNNEIETIFLSTNTNYSFLSSSLVKEVAKFGGNGGINGDGEKKYEKLYSLTEITEEDVSDWQTEAQVMNHIRYLAKLPNKKFSRDELLKEKLVAEHEEELMAEYKEL